MIEHAMEMQDVLVGLHLWDYLTEDEIEKLYNAQTDVDVDRLVRTYRNKYFDKMYEDYEKENILESDVNEDVKTADIPKAVKSILLRNKIYTSDDFLDILMEKGWNSIRGMGESSAKIAIHWALPNEDVKNYVKKYKTIKSEKI